MQRQSSKGRLIPMVQRARGRIETTRKAEKETTRTNY